MDRTLEIVLAAIVISVTGMALLFVLNGQSGDFTDFLDQESSDANCDLQWQKYQNAVKCPEAEEGQDGTSIREDYSSQCSSYNWDASEVCSS